jgi:F-type H+-transporting ATPase subunit gamma
MARSLRDIRRKMKAVRSTHQVTKAMELVAASKMRRAVQNAQMLRQYALAAWRILQRIAGAHPDLHPFLTEKPLKNILIVLMTSDRGLCGSLNFHLCRGLETYCKTLDPSVVQNAKFVAVGRKGQQFLARTGHKVAAAFPAFSNHASYRDVLPVSKFIIDQFRSGAVDHVVVIYPQFISALTQEVRTKVLLPFSAAEIEKIAMAGNPSSKKDPMTEKEASVQQFVFEPSATEVLDAVLPQLTEVQMYQIVLETAASEHSARMVAMRNASDNASDILGDLTLTYNQTRQANITAELAELSAGAAAAMA